jgi:nucleoside-diphosphate-sugar epimerase
MKLYIAGMRGMVGSAIDLAAQTRGYDVVGRSSKELELTNLIKKVVGYQEDIILDKTKPNGTPRKLLESSQIKALGWEPRLSLEMGIRNTYKWFLSNKSNLVI